MTRPFSSSSLVEVRAFCATREPDEIITIDDALALRASLIMAMSAIDDLRGELDRTRADRDRYLARMIVLEARQDAVREIVR
jgi:hypothetical protein